MKTGDLGGDETTHTVGDGQGVEHNVYYSTPVVRTLGEHGDGEHSPQEGYHGSMVSSGSDSKVEVVNVFTQLPPTLSAKSQDGDCPSGQSLICDADGKPRTYLQSCVSRLSIRTVGCSVLFGTIGVSSSEGASQEAWRDDLAIESNVSLFDSFLDGIEAVPGLASRDLDCFGVMIVV